MPTKKKYRKLASKAAGITRATANHIPRTKEAWTKEVLGIEAFLVRVEGMRSAQGDQWVDKISAYYRERLAALKEHPPGRSRIRRRATLEHPLREV